MSLRPFAFTTSLTLVTCANKVEGDGKTDNDTDTDSESTEYYGEAIIDELNWTDVKDLSETSPRRLLATYVGYYSYVVEGEGYRCTATLVAPTLVLTNKHCAESADYYTNVRVNFSYLEEEDYDSPTHLRDEGYSCTEYIVGSEEEDAALLKCPEEDNDNHVVGDDLGGYVELPLSDDVNIEDGVAIYILHQNCYYEEDEHCGWTEEDDRGEAIKKMSPGAVLEVPTNDYTTVENGWSFDGDGAFLNNADTLGGSSGALVFSESTHTVIGLHHAGTSDSDGTPIGNNARLLTSIIENVPDFVETIEEDIENHSTPPNLSDDDGDGYSENEGDCDDDDTTISPSAREYCNEYDDDCDGDVDEGDAVDASTYYADDDGDGQGDQSTTTEACSRPSGYVTNDNDCDDTDSSTYLGATESCDEEDNDCDGSTDEGVETTYYEDNDGDGYGDSSSTTEACSRPSSYVTNDDDCDDSASSVHPGATESCDEEDNDCDGTTDESTAVDASEWYADSDEDGYGDASSSVTACDQPTGYVSDSSDCDDSDATTYPGAEELCDDLDNDCDGSVEASGTFSPSFVGYTINDREYGVYCDDTGNDDDGNLEPGEQAEIEIELANDTCDDWFDVEGEGGTTSPLSFVGSTGADYTWGTVLAGYSEDGSHKFCVAVDSSATCGTYYDIDVRVYDGSGHSDYLTLSVYVSCS